MYAENNVITLSEQSAISFVKRVAQKYPALEQKRLKQCIQAVLAQLLNPLSPETRQQFFAALPEDVRRLATHALEEPRLQAGQKKPGRLDKHSFLTRIKVEIGLYDTQQIQSVIYAVLSSLAELLPADKSIQIRSALPASVKQLWTEALQEQATYSLDMQHFQQEIRFHFKPESDEQLKSIIRTVVSHLIHRFGGSVGSLIIHYLPEEIRLLIGQMEADREGSRRPTESITSAELLQIVQQEANLASSEDAKQALLGILRAVKRSALPMTDFFLMRMPYDWGQLWQQA